MFRSPLNHFSGIACPFLDSCTAPNCLFNHEGVVQKSNVDGRAIIQPQRKRVKLSSDVDNDRDTSTPQRQLQRNEETNVTKPEALENIQSGNQQNVTNSLNSTLSAPKTSIGRPDNEISPPPVRRRKAHASNSSESAESKLSLNPRAVSGSTAPHATRHLLLKTMHAEMTRLNNEAKQKADGEDRSFILSEAGLILCALAEEEEILRANSAVYANKMKMRVVAYKKMAFREWIEERKLALETPQSSSQAKAKNQKQLHIHSLSATQARQILRHLVAKQTTLSKHDYITTAPSQTDVEQARRADELAHGQEECDRCKSHFQVFPDRRTDNGALTTGGQCSYHPGRVKPVKRNPETRINTGPEKQYTCCNRPLGDTNTCMTAPCHVFKLSSPQRLASLTQFQCTPENSKVPKDQAVCFDCEMGYTTCGFELIRITAIAWPTGETLLDFLVKPIGIVLDLNTRFSGVTPEQFTNAEMYDESAPLELMAQIETPDGRMRQVKSPLVARALLFKLINPDTVLMGHSLENDLNVLRVIHPTIVDTAILFPHHAGLPFRQSLQHLAWTTLQRKIQAGPGHDSKEDAIATGDLVYFRVNKKWEGLAKQGWTFLGDQLQSPQTRELSGAKDVHNGETK